MPRLAVVFDSNVYRCLGASEFSQLRGELRRRRYAEDITAEELLLQLQFAIGAHGAHPF